jgi:hypothetical protein
MRQPPKTWLLVEALPDENDVLYLVADPKTPSRRVGVKWKTERPTSPDHFAEHFQAHTHVVDATDIRHLVHYRAAEKAGTLKIHGQCQAATREEAEQKLIPEQKLMPARKVSAPAPAAVKE